MAKLAKLEKILKKALWKEAGNGDMVLVSIPTIDAGVGHLGPGEWNYDVSIKMGRSKWVEVACGLARSEKEAKAKVIESILRLGEVAGQAVESLT